MFQAPKSNLCSTLFDERGVNKLKCPDDSCLLYTSDAADERSSVDLGGRRIIKKKKNKYTRDARDHTEITRSRSNMQRKR